MISLQIYEGKLLVASCIAFGQCVICGWMNKFLEGPVLNLMSSKGKCLHVRCINSLQNLPL